MTVAEVAEMLRLNQQTVRNWIDAGSLPAIRVGRRVRIKRADLNRLLDDGYRGTPDTATTGSGPNAADFWGGEPVGAVEPSTPATPGQGQGAKHTFDLADPVILPDPAADSDTEDAG